MGDLQNPLFSPVLTCFHARLAILTLMLWVYGLDVTFIRAYLTERCMENILKAWRLNEEELVFTVCDALYRWHTLFWPYFPSCVWYFIRACLYKNKSWRRRSVKRDRRKKKETRIDSGMLLFLYEGDRGELQQFIDFQNCSALIVIPGCWALFIGHTQHLGLWSLSEKPRLSQQALPTAHNPAPHSYPFMPTSQ